MRPGVVGLDVGLEVLVLVERVGGYEKMRFGQLQLRSEASRRHREAALLRGVGASLLRSKGLTCTFCSQADEHRALVDD